MKKILVVLMLLMTSLMAMGFVQAKNLPSNSFSLQTEVLLTGGVSQSISFPTLVEDLRKAYNEEDIEHYLENLQQKIEESVYNNIYMKYWIRYMDDPQSDYIIGGDYVQFVRPTITETKDKIYFTLKFSTLTAWNYYNEKTDEEEEENQSQWYNFVKKTESTSSFPFSEDVALSYVNMLENTIHDHFIDFDITSSKIYFEYDYITPSSKVKSNADIKQETSKGYLHAWLQKSENINKEKSVSLWYSVPNKGMWYLLVLGITVALLVITLVVLKIKKKQTKRC